MNRTKIRAVIKHFPMIERLAKAVWSAVRRLKKFPGSGSYWEERYAAGGTSGSGSYNKLATFKADVINGFVQRNEINSVIEFGSGDGNQLNLAHYKCYIGFDVSTHAIAMCRKAFAADKTKTFIHTDDYSDESADLTMSLDVIYHLIEDSIFELYMRRLFKSARRFVIIYSTNDDALNKKYGGYHVKHRQFTDWVERNASGWALMEILTNKYPYLESDPDNTSPANFYFYTRG